MKARTLVWLISRFGNEIGGKWSRWSLISVIENQGLYWVAVTSTKGGYERVVLWRHRMTMISLKCTCGEMEHGFYCLTQLGIRLFWMDEHPPLPPQCYIQRPPNERCLIQVHEDYTKLGFSLNSSHQSKWEWNWREESLMNRRVNVTSAQMMLKESQWCWARK